MAVQKEIVAITGKYTKDGQEKNRYTKLGVMMDTKNGPMLKLEVIPIGWDGWAYLNDPKPREATASKVETYEGGIRKPADTDDFHSDPIPF